MGRKPKINIGKVVKAIKKAPKKAAPFIDAGKHLSKAFMDVRSGNLKGAVNNVKAIQKSGDLKKMIKYTKEGIKTAKKLKAAKDEYDEGRKRRKVSREVPE